MDATKDPTGKQHSLTHLMEQRFMLNFSKLKTINEFVTNMLNRILECVSAITKRINDITVIIMRLEQKI